MRETEFQSRDVVEARRRLDELDGRIILLLKERMSFSALVQRARVAAGGCRTDSRREQVIISRYCAGLGPGGIEIALGLLRSCRGAEPWPVNVAGGGPVRRSFLGPAASVSQQAAEALEPSTAGELVPVSTLEDVIESLMTGRVDEAVVPLENSLSGPVDETLHGLAAAKGEAFIVSQVWMPVQWVLAVASGISLDAVHTVASHPHALAQTRQWLGLVLPDRPSLLGVASTSAAAAGLLEAQAPYEAVICTRRAAEHYRLRVIATPNRASATRFALLRHAPALPPPSGSDITSAVATVSQSALPGALSALPEAGIAVQNLHCLPAEAGGRLVWLECAGHASDFRVIHALAALREHCEQLHVVGSCPALGRNRRLAEG